jgi:hypothetical protein
MKQHKGAVIVTSDYEVDVRKHIFGLQQLSGVSFMEEVVKSFGIDSYRTWCFAAVGHFVGYLLGVVAQLSYPNCFRLIAERRRSTNRVRQIVDVVVGGDVVLRPTPGPLPRHGG